MPTICVSPRTDSTEGRFLIVLNDNKGIAYIIERKMDEQLNSQLHSEKMIPEISGEIRYVVGLGTKTNMYKMRRL